MRLPDPKTIIAYREAFGGRRFWITLGCGIVNTVLVAFKLIPADIYRDIIMGTVAAYIVGHTYGKVKGGSSVPDPGKS